MFKVAKTFGKLSRHLEVNFSTLPNTSLEPSSWHLVSSICLERLPTITPQLNEIQSRLQDVYTKKEFEISMLNNHEIRRREDLERTEKKKRGEEVEAVITASDMEDKWREEGSAFVAAPRATEADLTNNLASTHRKLDKPLRLMLKYKWGDTEHWNLPQAVRQNNETMRDAAERAVNSISDHTIDFQVLGNAPLSYYNYKYSKAFQEETGKRGAKVFIFKAYLGEKFHSDERQLILAKSESVVDYQWATIDELQSNLGKHTARAFFKMLHSDD